MLGPSALQNVEPEVRPEGWSLPNFQSEMDSNVQQACRPNCVTSEHVSQAIRTAFTHGARGPHAQRVVEQERNIGSSTSTCRVQTKVLPVLTQLSRRCIVTLPLVKPPLIVSTRGRVGAHVPSNVVEELKSVLQISREALRMEERRVRDQKLHHVTPAFVPSTILTASSRGPQRGVHAQHHVEAELSSNKLT